MLYSTADLAEACGCQRWFGAELIPTLQKGLTGSMAVYSRHCSLQRIEAVDGEVSRAVTWVPGIYTKWSKMPLPRFRNSGQPINCN